MDYSDWSKQRSKELYPGQNGRLQAEWTLTDTKLLDSVILSTPPLNAIPIIFVPGIMGSNLCDLGNRPVWLLNSVKGVPLRLAVEWAKRSAGERQEILHPERTKVYPGGAVPKNSMGSEQHFQRRGWGEVSEASYHKFLLWLEKKMNWERNPANWEDFSHSSITESIGVGERMVRKLPLGLVMKMSGLPEIAETGHAVDPVTSDELLKRSKSSFPVYAFGYNWLASNQDAAGALKTRIEKIITENNVGAIKCKQVILVSHSMGGLVARACSQLPEMDKKIVGIVHGVMPATGAAVAYRRCKVGMRDEDFGAGLVIGSNGREVTAVFAQSPGALQLLPSEDYGVKWMQVADPRGKIIVSLPEIDPYKEIYLERRKWWGLIREEWLSPEGGMPIQWRDFVVNIRIAQEFHRALKGKYHKRTYVFYGGGPAKKSFSKILWRIAKGIAPTEPGTAPPIASIPSMANGDLRTDGSNGLFVGGRTETRAVNNVAATTVVSIETSHWVLHCGGHDSSGDGTVPSSSGQSPRKNNKLNILQQFELDAIQHEPAYRDYPLAQQVTYYAITKLAANADLK